MYPRNDPPVLIELSRSVEGGIAHVNAGSLKSLDHPLVWWLCFAIGFAIVAASFSTDGTYDLENYHFYNGFAVFHDRKGLDIGGLSL
jgi:hypothetical protein